MGAGVALARWNGLKDHYARPPPMYLRLAKETASHPELNGRFRWGHVEVIGDGVEALVTLVRQTAMVPA